MSIKSTAGGGVLPDHQEISSGQPVEGPADPTKSKPAKKPTSAAPPQRESSPAPRRGEPGFCRNL